MEGRKGKQTYEKCKNLILASPNSFQAPATTNPNSSRTSTVKPNNKFLVGILDFYLKLDKI